MFDIQYESGAQISGFNAFPTNATTGKSSVSITGKTGVTSSFEFDSEIVSSVTIDGELAAVGVNSYGVLDLAGAVQTYRQLDDKWVEMPPLVAPSPRANEFFGASIDISGDRLAVGAPATNERFFGYPNWFKGSV